MEDRAIPALLPVLRSRQQAGLLTLLLGDPDLELSLSDLATRVGVPLSSVHREIERAERAGLVVSRRIGNVRLVRADPASPYHAGLADVLVKAFGPPRVLAEALADVAGIERAVIHGSWAARSEGVLGDRPVGDVDVLVLGDPDRDDVNARLARVEQRLGRPVHVDFRPADWLELGTGSFHDTVVASPLVDVPLTL